MGMNTLVVCPHCQKINRVALDRASNEAPICGSCQTALPLTHRVPELHAHTFRKLVASADRPVVVDFWAPWCGPCQMFTPTFQKAAAERGAELIFAKLNTEAHADAGTWFHIKSIPTLIVFEGGREIDRQSGALPLPQFLNYLARWKGHSAA